MVRGDTLEEPAAVIPHGGVCEGESVGAAKVDLNGHEAGNGGYSQGTPKARRAFLYSEIAHHRILAGQEIPNELWAK